MSRFPRAIIHFNRGGHRMDVLINRGFEDAARVAVKAAWRSKSNWGHNKEWAKKMYEVLKPYRDAFTTYFRRAAIGTGPGNPVTKKDEEPKRKQTKTVKEPSTMKKKKEHKTKKKRKKKTKKKGED